ncbi:hypothetical protein LCGC14_1386860 [marine sediment metagenome]|uniref:Recombination endonuclease VII n=1 Tax=marine sediment metagenome TaxID=412755 RepID=A0A0F9K186_9ZZZZ
MFEGQNGLCAICGKPETHRNYYGPVRLSVDHDHKTGKVRSLLCNNCNVALGLIKEDVGIAMKLLHYLVEHKTV